MAKFTDAENRRINTHRIDPTRASAIADNADGAYNVVELNDIVAEGVAGAISIRRKTFIVTNPPTDTMLPNAKVGDRALEYCFDSDESDDDIFEADMWIKTKNGWASVLGVNREIADPGDEGVIPVTTSGTVLLVTGAAETRTLAIPTKLNQQLHLQMQTDGGDCVITSAQAINAANNNTLTFADAGDYIILHAIKIGDALRWRVLANDVVALSTT